MYYGNTSVFREFRKGKIMPSDLIQQPYDSRIDYRFHVASHRKYLEDIVEKKLTKLCMTEVVNADLSIAMVGEEQYIQGCREVLLTIEKTLEEYQLTSAVFLYCYNYKNFIVAANDNISNEDFTNLMQAFYQGYELATASNNNLSAVSRFVLVFGNEDMLNRATSAHYVNRTSQINFLVATNEKEKMREELQDKMRVFDLINYAITSDTIVPFYQGIHNNQTGKIDKYEALMRIYGPKGKLFTPASFLDAAKELKLYPKISKIMLDKAMNDFKDKECELSLNITLSDIQSEEFRLWFLDRLSKHPDPSKITIEFVETENYNTGDMLINFVNDAKNIGCKIAIDDFGVGFATYTSIVSLKPDILKIDGDIIKNLIKNAENQIILSSICYMTKLINAKVVAEYIENEQLQQIVTDNGIEFSQGYYFAAPKPFNEINVE